MTSQESASGTPPAGTDNGERIHCSPSRPLHLFSQSWQCITPLRGRRGRKSRSPSCPCSRTESSCGGSEHRRRATSRASDVHRVLQNLPPLESFLDDVGSDASIVSTQTCSRDGVRIAVLPGHQDSSRSRGASDSSHIRVPTASPPRHLTNWIRPLPSLQSDSMASCFHGGSWESRHGLRLRLAPQLPLNSLPNNTDNALQNGRLESSLEANSLANATHHMSITDVDEDDDVSDEPAESSMDEVLAHARHFLVNALHDLAETSLRRPDSLSVHVASSNGQLANVASTGGSSPQASRTDPDDPDTVVESEDTIHGASSDAGHNELGEFWALLAYRQALAPEIVPDGRSSRLSDEQIRSLPRRSFKGAGSPQQCSICLEAFHESHFLTALPCDHSFHVDCVAKWLRHASFCPLCRTECVPEL